mmetsp:Transcript_23515/g.55416  ORF Transcript_23515/g.55416 Transcript_23515/m.55416 type:complete len:293 (-) Transcript_23515:534-1412(-)
MLVLSIAPLTHTVTVTPNMSMRTWMVVELWAGSSPQRYMARGRVAPMPTLLNTIMYRLVVIATVSAIGTMKTNARRKPANPNMRLRATPILASVQRNALRVRSFSVPTANPRMTLTEAWLPALPPAPTSMVRNWTMTRCDSRRVSFLARMKDEHDCRTRRPTSHPARSRTTDRKGVVPSTPLSITPALWLSLLLVLVDGPSMLTGWRSWSAKSSSSSSFKRALLSSSSSVSDSLAFRWCPPAAILPSPPFMQFVTSDVIFPPPGVFFFGGLPALLLLGEPPRPASRSCSLLL